MRSWERGIVGGGGRSVVRSVGTTALGGCRRVATSHAPRVDTREAGGAIATRRRRPLAPLRSILRVTPGGGGGGSEEGSRRCVAICDRASCPPATIRAPSESSFSKSALYSSSCSRVRSLSPGSPTAPSDCASLPSVSWNAPRRRWSQPSHQTPVVLCVCLSSVRSQSSGPICPSLSASDRSRAAKWRRKAVEGARGREARRACVTARGREARREREHLTHSRAGGGTSIASSRHPPHAR